MIFGRLSVVKKDLTEGAYFDIASDIILGRGPDCDIRLKICSVSRIHSKIFINEDTGGCLIENLSQSNPTIVNGKPLSSVLALHDNDEICIGGRSFIFKSGKSFLLHNRSFFHSLIVTFIHLIITHIITQFQNSLFFHFQTLRFQFFCHTQHFSSLLQSLLFT